jgi:acetyl esterase/lipase
MRQGRSPLGGAFALVLASWVFGCAGAPPTPAAPVRRGPRADRPPAATPPAEGPQPGAPIVERGIEFARHPQRNLLADVLRPPAPASAQLPAVIYIHGGGWRRALREQGHALLPQLVATGHYVGVTIEHRLSTEAPWPAQLHDAKAAVRWLRANAARYGVDPARIGAWGESSGGQIASVLGVTGGVAELEGDVPLPPGSARSEGPVSSRVQAVVSFCGPTDMEDFYASPRTPEAADAMRNRLEPLFGGPIPEHLDLVRSASAIQHVSPDDPPFLLMHGAKDDLVPFALSAAAHAALVRAGVPSVLVPVAGWGHGFRGAEIDERVRTFFDRHLRDQAIVVPTRPVRAERSPS